MTFDDQLAQLWPAGATLTQIERTTGVSRGVAIGRIHRARKAGDKRFAPRPPKPKAPKSRKLKPIGETIGSSRALPPPEPSGPVPFLLLRPGMCKFPLNSPERGSVSAAMVCCGAPVVQPGSSYCRRCTEITQSRTSSSASASPLLRAASPPQRVF